MSRIGKQMIPLPKGVKLVQTGSRVSVEGPKGSLSLDLHIDLEVEQEAEAVKIVMKDEKKHANFFGMYRALIANLVKGVSEGFVKQLEMIGVGYRAAVKGNKLDLLVGKSHPTSLDIPNDLEVKVENNTLISISGCDKQRIGQFASDVRSNRPPEPYKGKGIRYKGEYVRKKAGKSGKK